MPTLLVYPGRESRRSKTICEIPFTETEDLSLRCFDLKELSAVHTDLFCAIDEDTCRCRDHPSVGSWVVSEHILSTTDFAMEGQQVGGSVDFGRPGGYNDPPITCLYKKTLRKGGCAVYKQVPFHHATSYYDRLFSGAIYDGKLKKCVVYPFHFIVYNTTDRKPKQRFAIISDQYLMLAKNIPLILSY